MPEPAKRRLARKAVIPVLLILGAFGAAALGYVFWRPELHALWSAVRSEDSHPALLLGSFLVLPALGFPVSPFLILIGLRFGYITGVALMFCAMAAHLAAAYWVSRSFLRDRFEALARKNNLNIRDIPESRRIAFGFLFMAVPGLSYALKNYLLPLSGLSFLQYFLCGWLIQGAMGVPFVVLGGAAARWSIPLFLGLIGLVLVVFAFRKRIYETYNRVMESAMEK